MTAAPSSNTNSNDPFSFAEILASNDDDQVKQDPVKVLSSDGMELAVYIYEPPATVTKKDKANENTALVFYHGGGAHAGAGYQSMARGLAEKFGITVYLPDLRGHGASGGARGDAPSKEQVWKDVDTVLEFVAAKHDASSRRIFLGGHSSGGGLVVNCATAAQASITATTTTAPSVAPSILRNIEGYVLVSPELGYTSRTARPNRTDFAAVNVLAFIANGIFGWLGHSKAVKFNYPPELLKADKGMVGFNTVNMANAITPDSPVEQMQTMGKNPNDVASDDVARKPIGLWVGSNDELFVAEKVVELLPKKDHDKDNIIGEILPGKNHLGILVGVHEHIGPWITKL